MKTNSCLVICLLILGAVTWTMPMGCARNDKGSEGVKHPKYHCPMHPTVVSDRVIDCPICGMKLVPIVEAKPALPGLPGLAAISIAPDARQRMGLKLGSVENRVMVRRQMTSARVIEDETRFFRVTTKVDGWVDRLLVAVTGQAVRKGEPLLTIYSPALVSAQQEYLGILQSVRPVAGVASDVSAGGGRWLEAARQRLQFWDVGDEQIARLETTRQVEKVLTLYAPASGFVAEKTVLAGQKIMAGEPLMVIADYAVVWGDADIYASDLAYVQTGMPITVTFSYWPGKTFGGAVSFLSPSLDPETRTLKARLEIPNPDLLLKPGMFGDARLEYPLGEKLAVPETAIMRTGDHCYVFRDGAEGTLVPVEVKVGVRSDGYYEVLFGLNEGDRVVTAANFLVDSESSMRAAVEVLTGTEL